MTEPASTLDLVRRAQAGDREAFDFVVKRYEQRLEALIHLRLGRRLRTRVEVEDLVQETWKRAYQSIRGFEWHNEGSIFRWLGGIAEHVIKDQVRYHLKAKKRDGARSIPITYHTDRIMKRRGSRSSSPSKAIQREERFQRLEAALDHLSEEHREVVILAQVRGLSRKEIGERMGRSTDAVSMLLFRALRALKSLLDETGSLHLPLRTLDPSSGDSTARPGPGE